MFHPKLCGSAPLRVTCLNTYLITGGFGFFGGRMACYLRDIGHSVVLGSRSQRLSPQWLPGADVRKTEWQDENSLADACRGVDIVIHAAGMDAPDCANDPAGAFEMNRNGTARLVQAACRSGVRLLVFLSTAHVYSPRLEGVITEDTVSTNPHPYAASNLAGEKEVIGGTRNQNTRGIVIRLSNGFGVPASPDTRCGGLVVNDLCRQAVEARCLVLKTDGLQRRDFIAMSDAIDIIHRLTVMPEMPAAGTVFNLGGGWAPTIWEVALLIQERCHRTLGFLPRIERVTPPPGQKSLPLDFRSDALNRIGITVPSGQTGEIDRLLQYHRAIGAVNA